MPKQRIYTPDDLINAYIASQRSDHIDFVNYYNQLLLALQQAFGVIITTYEGVESNNRAIYMLFRSTIHSFTEIRTPGGGFSDASLIEKQLESSPIRVEVHQALDSIQALTENNIQLHRNLIKTLFSYLYNPIVATVASHDLYINGFDDSIEPYRDDYED